MAFMEILDRRAAYPARQRRGLVYSRGARHPRRRIPKLRLAGGNLEHISVGAAVPVLRRPAATGGSIGR